MTITAPISEEQFEETLSFIGHAQAVNILRAHDSAQRDAIHYLGGFRSVATEFLDKTEWVQTKDLPIKYLGKHRADVIKDMLDESRQSLSQAVKLLKALPGLVMYPGLSAKISDFLATQERQAKPVCECDDPDCLKGTQTFTPGPQEAQGAQAGDEHENFEAWHRSVVAGEPPHEKYHDGSYVNPHVNRYWTGWSARAALATQPAAGEPVYQYKGLSGEWIETKQAYYEYQKRHGWPVRVLWTAPPVAAGETLALTVWYGSMPESNGKTNWTAILHRKGDGLMDGPHLTIARSEYHDRVRYEADQVRHIIGELAEEPDILAYDADAHSGYKAPLAAAHEDETVRKRIHQLEVLLDRCRDHVSQSMELMEDYDDAEEDAGIASELIADIDAAMRAQAVAQEVSRG